LTFFLNFCENFFKKLSLFSKNLYNAKNFLSNFCNMNILRYAFKNIFRNFFLSISSILTIALLVFFVNILLLVVHSSETFIASVNDKIAVTISFQK
jgi:hypothetical protein